MTMIITMTMTMTLLIMMMANEMLRHVECGSDLCPRMRNSSRGSSGNGSRALLKPA